MKKRKVWTKCINMMAVMCPFLVQISTSTILSTQGSIKLTTGRHSCFRQKYIFRKSCDFFAQRFDGIAW
ncbi:unnamed protein product [Lasius platythorax]|uniref:Secreted protein n=1 Tax=Lasius platythorax TaxID=488582 RepID=A0AAV2NG14_9HYME